MRIPTGRFSSLVGNYIKYRPHYPKSILSYLQKNINLKPDHIIADVGSGTGISSELFLENNNLVYGVEPNEAMRKAAEQYLSNHKNYVSVNGKAEATTLANQSIDIIIAAQAFHWFNRSETNAEFKRILKPSGIVALLFNERTVDTPFLNAYEQLLINFGTDYQQVDHRQINGQILIDFYNHSNFGSAVFKHKQIFDFEALKGRLESTSYVPDSNHQRYPAMIEELEKLFNQFHHHNQVEIHYDCKLYFGKLHS